MRFLIFNIAVAGALVYLVTGGNLPVNDLVKNFSADSAVAAKLDKVDQVDAENEKIREAVSEAMAKMRAAATVEPINTQPLESTPKPVETAKPVKRVKATEGKQATVLPPVTEGRDVGRDPGHVIDPAKARPLAARSDTPPNNTVKAADAAARVEPASGLSPDIAERRAEVLADTSSRSTSPANIQLEEGASLMKPAVRLKELQALSDELEFMYLERRGG